MNGANQPIKALSGCFALKLPCGVDNPNACACFYGLINSRLIYWPFWSFLSVINGFIEAGGIVLTQINLGQSVFLFQSSPESHVRYLLTSSHFLRALHCFITPS